MGFFLIGLIIGYMVGVDGRETFIKTVEVEIKKTVETVEEQIKNLK